MDLLNIFNNTPAEKFRVAEKRTGIFQVVAPLFHEDGDMMSIFLSEGTDGKIRLSDEGMSLMRLSYNFDIDSINKENILNRAISERHAVNDGGNIIMDVTPDRIYPAIMEYSQLVNNVCNFDILSRENVNNLFYENLRDVMTQKFKPMYDYEENIYLNSHNDMKVDYVFARDSKAPICLFGVKDTNKAQQVTIYCYQMLTSDTPIRSVVVFEDMDNNITKFARNSLINSTGKIFSDIEGFESKGLQYLQTEISA